MWRVGTVSMGVTLLLLGIFLFISQFTGWDHMKILLSWWPIILIVLGIEILLFIFLSKQEKTVLKYDFLSIFFVGVLGTVGIVFTLLNTTGVLELFEHKMMQEERTFDLPVFEQQIGESIERVVINSHYPLLVESTKHGEVTMFGTYRGTVSDHQPLLETVNDYLLVQEKGDTLFIEMKKLPQKAYDLGDSYFIMEATILVPSHVKLEINANHSEVTMKPRDLKSDWMIETAYQVGLIIEKESDVKISMENVAEIVAEDEQTSQMKEWVFGNGSSVIQILKANEVRMQTRN